MDVADLGKIMDIIGKKYKNEKKAYETFIETWKNLENTENLEGIAKELNNLQKITNKYYTKYGLSDEILDLQLWINKTRNKYDISDPNELLDNGFVQ